MTINKWLKYASNLLKQNKILTHQLESVILLSFVLKKPKSWIYGFNETKINFKQFKILQNFLKRRIQGEPIAYLLGFCEFWSLKIYVSPFVLIPRKDTEVLINVVFKKINNNVKKILDLGTGSGAIALAIASKYKFLKITAIDISKRIINLAKYNAKALYIHNINFFVSNWFNNLRNNKFDIIISNPPYISNYEYYQLKKELKFEPIKSLISLNNGLSDLIYIIRKSIYYLNNNGWLILEHGYKQGYILKKIFKINNFKNISQFYDIQKHHRVICGQKFKKN
ncbi:peptide chain release factor N(5)-glutamine methyltransferase [Enterobacteriaceae endosymbiont of Donacia bicoloricornis]|uniref:peptide chain release factor N(5)-glutamine methyltransferase n=1 Tax=Enterobacteriaceae endosymbiont of Donacia bicoloricornis TaxID=2675772 RepID=UPI001448D5B9|nr:peptide chain release factor N(5)-glutamine methyltransferase [Enterobacteriaceae endosymbiont of Donacia bicoloricornis]QJC37637.1 peptide chain release factor N(5)-glutamine methyltransferase [Enterobacteriaceae endosymbiont of Donacia bicoloricornis]